MQIQEIMQKFIDLDYSLAWGGPKHPDYPNTIIADQVAELWQKYPELKRDEAFVDYIETYAGALMIYPDDSVAVLVAGLWDYTGHLLHYEGSRAGEYINFCEIIFEFVKEGELSGVVFAFKLSDMPGVYRYTHYEGEMYDPTKKIPYERYCDTFIEWLERLVEAKGKLTD